MHLEMRNVYGFGIITILSFVLSIHGLEPQETCLTLKYNKSDVANKPELILTNVITVDVIGYYLQSFYYGGICRFGSGMKNSEAEWLANMSVERIIIEYDPVDRELYYYDISSMIVHKIRLDTKETSMVYKFPFSSRPRMGCQGVVGKPTLDWATKNLYFTHHELVHVVDLKNNNKTAKNLFMPLHDQESLKVFPNEGYLIKGVHGGGIFRHHQDGSNRVILYGNISVYINQIALDYHTQNIYWHETVDSLPEIQQIRYMNLYGGPVKTLDIKVNSNYSIDSRYLMVDKDYVYFVINNYDQCYIHCDAQLVRANKVDGVFDEDFSVFENGNKTVGLSEFSDAMVIESQKIAKDHPCKDRNGDCSGICVAVPDVDKKLSKKCIDN